MYAKVGIVTTKIANTLVVYLSSHETCVRMQLRMMDGNRYISYGADAFPPGRLI